MMRGRPMKPSADGSGLRPSAHKKTLDTTRGRVLFGAAWLLFGVPCLVLGLGFGYKEVSDARQLREHGESTRGIVLRKVAEYHGPCPHAAVPAAPPRVAPRVGQVK